MRCKDVQEQLVSYIDKVLPAETSKKIWEHLKGCSEYEEKYRLYQKTDEALREFGGAVRAGLVNMDAPPLPSLPKRPFWVQIYNGFQTPIPLWATCMAVILMLALVTFSPLHLPMKRGKQKSNTVSGITSPLAAETMLEFLIVPDPTDPKELTASIRTIENFLKAHPENLPMHEALTEFYEAKLKLKSLTKAEREALGEKLSNKRQQLAELRHRRSQIEGDGNVKE